MKVKLIRISALIICCLSGANFLSAQQGRPIALEEVVELSIRNSGHLKISDAKVEQAAAALKEAIEKKLPDATISGSYLRIAKPNIDLKTDSGGGQPGGNINSAMYGIANISLPLYSGSKIKYGIESARYLAEAAKLDADFNKQEIILNAINAFNNLYKARAAVNVVKESLTGAQERVKQFENLEKNGLLPRNDLLKGELQASNIEIALLDAENNWKLANINMDLMLGFPDTLLLDPAIGLSPSSEPVKSVEELVQTALQNRKDIAALSLREKAAASGIKIAKGDYYPGLTFTGGYIAAHIPGFLTITNAINVGVGVKYSLSSIWKTKSKIEQAKAEQKQVAANEGLLSDAVRLEVRQSYLNYLLSRKKIDMYAKAVAQSEENYRILKNKYDNSLATTTDLLDADVERLQARLNSAFSESDAAAAYSKLLQSAGLLTADNKNK